MSRRRYRRKDPLDLIGPIFALVFIIGLVSPQFRALIALLPIVLIICAAIVLIGIAIWLILQVGKITESGDMPSQSQVLDGKSLVAPPAQITSDLLTELEWRRFEILVTAYFRKTGFMAERNRVGADGGVDIILTRPGEPAPCACVQCKAWKTYKVGVKPVRELLGVMAADKIPEGYFVASGEYTFEALNFAQGKPLTLISGRQLLDMLGQLPETDRADILKEVTVGDYTTPTCPRCDIKMVERRGSNGIFWGCRNYPRCRQTFNIHDDKEKVGQYATG